MQRNPQILVLIDCSERKLCLEQRQHPVMLRHQPLPENHEVVEVDQPRPTLFVGLHLTVRLGSTLRRIRIKFETEFPNLYQIDC